MDGLVFVSRIEPESARDFALFESLQTLGRLENDVVAVDLPEPLALGAYAHDQEVDGNVGLVAKGHIFLHERDNDLRFLGHGQAVLRVVEPAIVRVQVHFRVLRLFVAVGEGGVGTTGRDALPLSANRELLPRVGENLAHVDLIVVGLPVFVVHPPVSVIFERVTELFAQFKLVIPSLVFIAEPASPLARTRAPGISNVEQLKLV
mmetsp:Transcript_32336/g.40072  ORF Transcript_32336/g.40072 Transcript_32336/m.40072 type:complete len:205 (-) Transcript_32336:20-634(-)